MDEILNSAPCGFLAFTDDGVIVEVNETFANYLQYTPTELKNKKIESLFTIANRIFYQTHFFPLLKLREHVEEIFLTLKGRTIEVPVMVNAIRKLTDGNHVNHCIFVQVHQRLKYETEILKAKKIAEETLTKNEELIFLKQELEIHKEELDKKVTKLSQINKELVQLSSIISHDLQEPIRKIAMFADLVALEQRDALSETARERLNKIQQNCTRMRDLAQCLDQFMTVEKIGKPSSVELNSLIELAQLNVEQKIGNTINFRHDNLPTITGYTEQLVILFSHLFDNSFKFRSPQRVLEVVVTHKIIAQNTFQSIKGKYKYNEYLQIEFCDNGIGFDNSYSEYVFNVFKKIENNFSGIGFGLALCKKIVESHNGTISCSSKEDEGTCFLITLPLSQ